MAQDQLLSTFCGSPPYAAPELFRDESYLGPPVDYWALGVLLYFMVTSNMPFRAQTIVNLKKLILDCDYDFPHYLSVECCTLIAGLLHPDPMRRYNPRQARATRWLRNRIPVPGFPKMQLDKLLQQQQQHLAIRRKTLSEFSVMDYDFTKTNQNLPTTCANNNKSNRLSMIEQSNIPSDEAVHHVHPHQNTFLMTNAQKIFSHLEALGIDNKLLRKHLTKGSLSPIVGTFNIVLFRCMVESMKPAHLMMVTRSGDTLDDNHFAVTANNRLRRSTSIHVTALNNNNNNINSAATNQCNCKPRSAVKRLSPSQNQNHVSPTTAVTKVNTRAGKQLSSEAPQQTPKKYQPNRNSARSTNNGDKNSNSKSKKLNESESNNSENKKSRFVKMIKSGNHNQNFHENNNEQNNFKRKNNNNNTYNNNIINNNIINNDNNIINDDDNNNNNININFNQQQTNISDNGTKSNSEVDGLIIMKGNINKIDTKANNNKLREANKPIPIATDETTDGKTMTTTTAGENQPPNSLKVQRQRSADNSTNPYENYSTTPTNPTSIGITSGSNNLTSNNVESHNDHHYHCTVNSIGRLSRSWRTIKQLITAGNAICSGVCEDNHAATYPNSRQNRSTSSVTHSINNSNKSGSQQQQGYSPDKHHVMYKTATMQIMPYSFNNNSNNYDNNWSTITKPGPMSDRLRRAHTTPNVSDCYRQPLIMMSRVNNNNYKRYSSHYPSPKPNSSFSRNTNNSRCIIF